MTLVALEVEFDLRFDVKVLNYPDIHVHVASNSHFGGLWGRGVLQMTSEVAYDLKFELSGLINLCSHGSVVVPLDKSSTEK